MGTSHFMTWNILKNVYALTLVAHILKRVYTQGSGFNKSTASSGTFLSETRCVFFCLFVFLFSCEHVVVKNNSKLFFFN